MSESIRVLKMCSLDMHATDQDAVFMRNETNNIMALVLNEKKLKRMCNTSVTRVIYNSKAAVDRLIAGGEETALKRDENAIIAQVERSGLVYRLFESQTLHELRLMPLDSNWPRVVTVHMYEGALVGIDDLPVIGLQPVILRRIDRSNSLDTREFERVLSSATNRQVLIVVNPDDGHTIEHVFVPHYDAQIPEEQRHFKHQSVPFVQRWPLVLTDEKTLVDWRGWVGRRRSPRTSPPERTFCCIKNESEIRRGDWTVDPNQVFYCCNADGGVRVWHWRERMCSSENREFFPTLVFDPQTKRVTFTGLERNYPLAAGGSETCTWFFADLLQTEIADAPLDPQIHDASSAAPSGAATAIMLARQTELALANLLDLSTIVKSAYVQKQTQ